MKVNNKFHLLPANLEYFNMKNLKEELDNYKYLNWYNSKNNGNRIHIYELGDIVYIYYKNLTDGSNRILFRGEVINADCTIKCNGVENRCIQIGNLKAISLKNKTIFNYQNIHTIYGIEIYRTPEALCTFNEYDDQNIKNEDLENHGKVLLVRKLEEIYKNNNDSINETFKYFNENKLCDCCRALNIKNWKSRTFIKDNGFSYYEIHHLLMQNLLRNQEKNNLNWFKPSIIDSEFNKINLCPTCHREIHYGQNRKIMIDKLIEIKEVKHNLEKELSISKEKVEEIIKFIYSQYGI